jgi:hypothetical protein
MPPECTLYRIVPPYRHFDPVRVVRAQPPGGALGLLVRSHTQSRTLRRQADHVARMAPSATVLAICSESDEGLWQHAMRVASDAWIPLVALEEKRLEPSLREMLTRTGSIGRSFKQWLRNIEVTNDERLISLFGRMLDEAADQWPSDCSRVVENAQEALKPIPKLAAEIGFAPRGVRAACARRGCRRPCAGRGSPVGWFRLWRSSDARMPALQPSHWRSATVARKISPT